jgi:hypothetical protein
VEGCFLVGLKITERDLNVKLDFLKSRILRVVDLGIGSGSSVRGRSVSRRCALIRIRDATCEVGHDGSVGVWSRRVEDPDSN